jgi:hypothetical protein
LKLKFSQLRYDVILNQGLRLLIFSWECVVLFTKVFDGYGIAY